MRSTKNAEHDVKGELLDGVGHEQLSAAEVEQS
jgi:hypothetical protein